MTPAVSLIGAALLFLAVLDGLLAVLALGWSEVFTRFFFGPNAEDESAQLLRHAGLWLTFSLVQFAAFWYWATYPFLLLVVVGVRLSEWCADWWVLLGRTKLTLSGSVLFFLSSPFTIAFALYFYWGFYRYPGVSAPILFVPGLEPSGLILSGLIVLLVLVDTFLGGITLRYPQILLKKVHGNTTVEPGGWLKRTGGIWFGFAVFQAVVLFAWHGRPELLVVLAGVRLTEALADWIYLRKLNNPTTLAKIILAASPPINMLLAFVFYHGYMSVL